MDPRTLLQGLPPEALPVAVAVLVSVAVGAGLLALRPKSSRVASLEGRMQGIARPARHSSRRRPADVEKDRRRRQVEDTLREQAARQRSNARSRARPTLIGRLRQAGLGWSRSTYVLVCAALGGVIFLAVMAVGLGAVAAIGFGIAGGLLLPHFYVSRRRTKRMKAFTAEFPNTLDAMVRGIQAGLPLGDALKTVATEAPEPMRTEFRGIVHDQTLGLPLDQAMERLADRVPLAETSFFSIVIAIQSRTGGNLSEALSNLAKVLRDRKQMREKIKAMSMEAKASAGIIGSIPPVVAGVLYFSSPDYITLLFTTSTGHFALIGSVLWMSIGVFVMTKMINFDF